MLIGEVVKRTGISKDAIRFYEKQGLITIGRKERRENNYKEYSEAVVRRLLHLKKLKSLGFTLNESGVALDMIEANEATCRNMAGKIDEKIGLLDRKIREMQQVRDLLKEKLTLCRERNGVEPDENCPIVMAEDKPE